MEAAQHPWPALGVLLVRDGLVSKEQLEAILEEQRDARHKRISGHHLGELLVARGLVTPNQVAKLVAEQYELPFVDLATFDIDLRVARLLDEEIARRLSAVPISAREDGSYLLAIADPATVLFSDELRSALGSALHFIVVGPEAIEAALAVVHERPYALPVTTAVPGGEEWQGVVVELRSEDSPATPAFDAESAVETPTVTHRGPPLGALLLREGLVTHDELERALTQQSLSTSWRLGEILVDHGVVTAAVVARLIAEQYELLYTELANLYIDPQVASLLPREIAREFPAVPIAEHPDGSLEVAIADPTNVYYSDELHSALGVPLTFVVAAPDAIDALLDATHTTAAVIHVQPEEEPVEIESAVPPLPDPEDSATIEYVEDIVSQARDLPEFVDEPVEAESAAPPLPDPEDSATIEGVEDIVSEARHLPEFVDEFVVVEEPYAMEVGALAEVPMGDEEDEAWLPTWTTDFQVDAGAVEADEPEAESADEPETTDIPADDLSAALLAEVSDSAPSEPEPALDAEHGAPFALVEIAHTEELDETETADEMTAPEAVFEPVDVDQFDDTLDSTEPEAPRDELDVDDQVADADDLDAAIEEVLTLGASAIHFSPQGEWHTVRARIDGLVRELGVVAKEDVEALLERVGASAAMRVNVVRTKQGDKVVLFPREQAGSPRVLADLGLTTAAQDAVRAALAVPSGAIVACGPIGSGTTTTLYAALAAFAAPDRVVASIEDPVERVLDGVDQIEVDDVSGVTFADGLRTLLANDSDAVLVGEIRDQETADVAFQAALDGRHVLAGVRAPSTAAAIRRLVDIGLDSRVLGAALTCVVAQRLVRRVCDNCRETYYATDSERAELGQPAGGTGPRLLARGRGCDACDGTGFRGRVGLFEVLNVTEDTRALVSEGASERKIHRAAEAAGMQTLRDEAVRLCLDGVTTAAEVQRVLGAAG